MRIKIFSQEAILSVTDLTYRQKNMHLKFNVFTLAMCSINNSE